MSIIVPEESTNFLALDSAAFDDGFAASAHLLQRMVRSSNYLAQRKEWLMGFVLPIAKQEISTGEGTSSYDPSLRIAPADWQRLTWPMPYGKPGLANKGSAKIVYSSDATAYVQIATTAAPFSPTAKEGDANVVKLTSGSLQTATLDNIPLPKGQNIDAVELYVKGLVGAEPSGVGTPMADTNGGVEFDRAFEQGSTPSGGVWALEDSTFAYWTAVAGWAPFSATEASWTLTGAGTNLATEGAALQGLDASGNVVWTKQVYRVTDNYVVEIEPVNAREVRAFRQGGGRWRFRKLTRLAILSFALVGGA